ncbi:class I SAM-dependent methyltransferase [Methanoregula sp.]|uniref:class I SAM-dependent methyltransferase n=1 Tax=Methanoregula sp. TaxID=2052170 RepID=UPI0035696E3A
MTGNQDPYPVSDTAALVMLWAARYYAEKPLLGTYLHRLDLSAGQPLLDRYNGICPWYSEVIINRKHFIRSTVEELLRGRNKPTVIVNLGAGFSPLALELLPFLSDQVRFIEMDMRNMDRKTRLYADLIPDPCRFISCREADIGNTACLDDTLAGMVNYEKTRLIVVMEGLTYYIGRPVMERVLGCLSGLALDETLIFEHLKPCRLVSSERKFIPYEIFSHVRDYTGMDRMTTYSDSGIRTMLGPAFSCRYSDMDEMEKRRTETNTYFPTPDSGWLSCAVASRRSEE